MPARWFRILIALVVMASALSASDVPVHYQEGLTHGFLVLSTLDGNPIAVGDLEEVVRGRRVTNHLVYHFKDGSLQDETAIFSQRGTFRLISYRLIQKGPSFPHTSDLSIAANGEVKVSYTDDKGNEKVEDERMKLPSDLANGLVLTLLKNLAPNSSTLEVPIVVATPKPRVVKLKISSNGTEPFTLAGSKREAIHYVIKVDIGGVTGALASLFGKEPPDAHVWIIGGVAPTFVKSETLSFLGGPVWRTELVAPVWPKSETAEPKKEDEKH